MPSEAGGPARGARPQKDGARAPRARPKREGRYHHGDLKRALMDAALVVVEREGVEAVSLSTLARKLRVSSGAPFRHFATREALLVALAEEGALRMVRALDEAAAKVDDPLEKDRARGVAYVGFAVVERGVFTLLTRPEIARASPMLRAMSDAQEALMEPALGAHHRGRAAKRLAARSAGLLAAQALTYGLARMIVDGHLGEVSREDAEALARELTSVLGEGLARRA